jgi:hypothetical protein
MDINTIIVVGVDGFLIVFFIYALFISFGGTGRKAVESPKPQFRLQQRPQFKMPQRLQVREEQRPQVTASPKPEVAVPPRLEVSASSGPEVTEQSQVGESRKIVDIEQIGPFYAEKLKTIGIETTNDLLRTGATSRGQMEITGKTGISPKLILEWVNLARASL